MKQMEWSVSEEKGLRGEDLTGNQLKLTIIEKSRHEQGDIAIMVNSYML